MWKVESSSVNIKIFSNSVCDTYILYIIFKTAAIFSTEWFFIAFQSVWTSLLLAGPATQSAWQQQCDFHDPVSQRRLPSALVLSTTPRSDIPFIWFSLSTPTKNLIFPTSVSCLYFACLWLCAIQSTIACLFSFVFAYICIWLCLCLNMSLTLC